ncbi:class I glutamine amidotransferase-like protein [Peniophora sp. CONT]|nr:class I glutamine amidotransferase-like protein [Peniophora sp. CONT]
MVNVLMVYTSCSKTLTGGATGWYLPEAAHPYYSFANAGFNVDFAAPAGPNPPVDEYSVKTFTDDESQKFLKDDAVVNKLATAIPLKDVDVSKYDAIFYVGGHGPVIDLAVDPINIALAGKFWQTGKIVSAVCHGPAALVGVTDADGKSIFAGRTATAFSNAEEETVKATESVPFLVESRIVELGGKYEKAAEQWGVKVSVDGKLFTGQNPASAKVLGDELVKALKA